MQIKAIIDRIEGNYAILLLDREEEQIQWPFSMLPDKAKEGEIILFDIFLDNKATEQRKEEIDHLWGKIDKKSI